MKKLMVLLAVLLMFIPAYGCKKRLTQYTDGTITLTLPEGFTEGHSDDYEYMLTSGDAIVLCSHADKKFLENNGIEDITLDEFTAFFSSDKTLLLDRSFKNYNVFSYESEINGVTSYNMIGVYQVEDGFWLVNFICDNTDVKKFEADFLDWAGMVTFRSH